MKKSRGYTLVELLTVVLVIGILLTLAIPAYHAWMSRNRTMTQVNQLVGVINFARSEAIKRQMTITVCATDDGEKCGTAWEKGWMVFVDKQNTGQMAEGDTKLRIYGPLQPNARLQWNATRSNNFLQLAPSGGTRGQDGTFTYCADAQSTDPGTTIIVSQTGRIRVGSDGKCAMLYPTNNAHPL